MVYKIAIIGGGQIGSRHLQGFAQINLPVSLTVVDPSEESLSVAKTRFEQTPKNANVKQVSFCSSLLQIPHPLDAAIIATNANVRAQVVVDLLSHTSVRVFILEKIAFQSIGEFRLVKDLLAEKEAKAWVNCSRRMYPFYQEVRNCLGSDEKLYFHLISGDFGMGSNTIHHLDLFSFLTGQQEWSLDGTGLDPQMIPSRKEGFFELTGLLKGKAGNGSEFSIVSRQYSKAPAVFQIMGLNVMFSIMESQGKALRAERAKQWKWEEVVFQIPFQSQLTHLAVQQILETGDCDLTELEMSSRLHRPLLETFTTHFEKLSGKTYPRCPIT